MWTKSNIRLSDLAESIGCGTVGSKVAEGEKHLNNLTLRGLSVLGLEDRNFLYLKLSVW